MNDPIFFTFLVNLDQFGLENGFIKEELSEELLNIGQAQGLTEIDHLKPNKIRIIAKSASEERFEVYPAWLQFAASILALENNIPVTNRVAVALAKVHLPNYQKDKGKTLNFDSFIIYIEINTARQMPKESLSKIRTLLTNLKYTLA